MEGWIFSIILAIIIAILFIKLSKKQVLDKTQKY